MHQMLEELKAAEQVYRNSVPDITHNHVRLLYSPRLWSTMLDSAVTGWKVRNLIDEQCEEKLREQHTAGAAFLPDRVSADHWPFFQANLGPALLAEALWEMVTSWSYLRQAVRGKVMEKIIRWHRSGRIDDEHALTAAGQVWRLLYHLPLSVLPVGLHRFLTDWQYAKDGLDYLVLRPVRLYFNAELREQWLRDMVTEGKKKHLLSDEDAEVILSQIKEPFIQKYLKSLAVHVCTLPVTQVVSVLVAIIYVVMHPDMPRGQAYGIGLGIIALFQVVPISPGSLVRGLYVVYLVMRERNFKDYNIAVFLGFFKYIGYLAFPIQMTYRYPALARFMAGHWATEAVHIVPVFGERGALLEHGVFCLFYNWPLTIRRRMKKRGEMRALIPPRYWHIVLCAIVGSGIFGIADFLPQVRGEAAGFNGDLVACSAGTGALRCRGDFGGRWGGNVEAGDWRGSLRCCNRDTLHGPACHSLAMAGDIGMGAMALNGLWRIFIFTILSTAAVLLTEISLPESESVVGERGS